MTKEVRMTKPEADSTPFQGFHLAFIIRQRGYALYSGTPNMLWLAISARTVLQHFIGRRADLSGLLNEPEE